MFSGIIKSEILSTRNLPNLIFFSVVMFCNAKRSVLYAQALLLTGVLRHGDKASRNVILLFHGSERKYLGKA